MIIAGDIGGTKTNLAIFSPEEGDYALHHFASYPSQEYSDLKSIVLKFLEECRAKMNLSHITAATFAIAGPVQNQVARATNLPWVVDAKVLCETCHIPEVYLLNDLEANAYAIDILPQDSLATLYPGKGPCAGNRGVCSPGTGLGEAGLYWDGTRHHPFACEGGHAELGPRNELELELCRYLIKEFGHSSYERVLSGPGIHVIYSFLKEVEGYEEPDWLCEQLKNEDPSKVISHVGLQDKAKICEETLNLFVSLLGAEAGNLALKLMALGGIYLGGGIPPKILPKLKLPIFSHSFVDKGRLQPILEEIPIKVILDDKAALKGSAHYCRMAAKRKATLLKK